LSNAVRSAGALRAGAAMADITPAMGIQLAGYVPTRRAFAGGGYETRTAGWSRLAPEALEIIERETVGLLRELFETS